MTWLDTWAFLKVAWMVSEAAVALALLAWLISKSKRSHRDK